MSSSVSPLTPEHTKYKTNIGYIAKYGIIIGIILLISSYITHSLSYLYKEKILPYMIGFLRKLFLILGSIFLLIGIIFSVFWNYYV